MTNTKGKPVAVVIGATSKWQSDGRNTKLIHGAAVDDSHLPVGVRWGVGGAIAQKFAKEGFFTVLTTRAEVDLWLTAPLSEALALQRPLPDGALRIVARGQKRDGPDEL